MYAIFFDYKNKTYRLPVNPEEITITSVQAIEKYEILKLGQIAVPTHMELKEYKFQAELPSVKIEPLAGIKAGMNIALGLPAESNIGIPHYVESPNKFKNADYYLELFEKIRKKGDPVRFIASNGIGDDINTLVLMEELEITERAGEEGDKYVSFKLLEYQEHSKKVTVVDKEKGKPKKKTGKKEETNPKSTGSYIVKKGDSLWSIAKKFYGNGVKSNLIFNANKNIIKNPNMIQVGWKLKIPSIGEASKYSTPLPKPVKKEAPIPSANTATKPVSNKVATKTFTPPPQKTSIGEYRGGGGITRYVQKY